MTWIELIAAIITAYSIWLATKENIWYWPTGLVSLVLYTWVYFRARLYGESLLQIICLVLMIYGWYEWLHGGANRRELPVSRTPAPAWPLLLGIGAAGTYGAGLMMRRFTDNPAPWVDASILVFSLVAQFMTARKWLENWSLWMIINVVSVVLYINRNLYITAGLYVGLFILAVLGHFKWRRSLAFA